MTPKRKYTAKERARYAKASELLGRACAQVGTSPTEVRRRVGRKGGICRMPHHVRARRMFSELCAMHGIGARVEARTLGCASHSGATWRRNGVTLTGESRRGG